MPVNKIWNVEKLIEACRYYYGETGRRISFEYAVIGGVNDRFEDAKELSLLLRGLLCHINLIPVNPIENGEYHPPSKKNLLEFQNNLIKMGMNATIRRTLGGDISASCGQLKHSVQKGGNAN